jgi:hypothetical protein
MGKNVKTKTDIDIEQERDWREATQIYIARPRLQIQMIGKNIQVLETSDFV